jgi:chromosome segregation ATPase
MAEKKVIEIDIETNLGSLKSQLREAQSEVASLSDKFGATSREAAEAAKRAADLKDRRCESVNRCF